MEVGWGCGCPLIGDTDLLPEACRELRVLFR
jgi:hypothetical protein